MADLVKVEDRVKELRQFFEANKQKLAAILPKHFSPDRQGQLLFTAVYKNPDLLGCTPASLVGAIMQGGMLGLEPVGPGGYWLVPFWQKANPAKNIPARRNVTMIIDYRGLLGMARRTREVKVVDWREVRAGDTFAYEYGTGAYLKHTPAPEPVHVVSKDGKTTTEREITHFYAFGVLRDGGMVFEVMRKEDVEWHRDRYSKAAGSGPWTTNFSEMGGKTCVRKLSDKLPFDPLLSRAVEIDAKTEQGIEENFEALLGFAGEDGPPTGGGPLDRMTDALLERDKKAKNGGGDPPSDQTSQEPKSSVSPVASAASTVPTPAPTSAPAQSDGPSAGSGPASPVGGTVTTHGLIDAINQAYADLDMAGSKDAGKRSFLWVRYIGAAVGPEKASVEQLTKLKDYLVDLVGKKRAQS
jgi:recombination protein RecT